MPLLLKKKTVHTKALNVTMGGQSVLLEMYNSPELIHELYIEGNEICVIIENPFEKETQWKKHVIGVIRDEYLPLLREERTPVKQWKITGGEKLDGYGSMNKYFGLNITFGF